MDSRVEPVALESTQEEQETAELQVLNFPSSPLKKLLTTQLAQNTFNQFMDQPSEAIAQQLLNEIDNGEQLDFTIATWMELFKHVNFFDACINLDPRLTHHIQQQFILQELEQPQILALFKHHHCEPIQRLFKDLSTEQGEEEASSASSNTSARFNESRVLDCMVKNHITLLRLQPPQKLATLLYNWEFDRPNGPHISPQARFHLMNNNLLAGFTPEQVSQLSKRGNSEKFSLALREFGTRLQQNLQSTFDLNNFHKVALVGVQMPTGVLKRTDGSILHSIVTRQSAKEVLIILESQPDAKLQSEQDIINLACSHREIAVALLDIPKLADQLTEKFIETIANAHIDFALEVLTRLDDPTCSLLPQSHWIRQIGSMSIEELTQNIHSATECDARVIWSIAALLKAGYQGNYSCFYTVANLYEAGQLVTQDPIMAHSLYTQSAIGGHLPAMLKVARNYFTGHGTMPNRDLAFAFYRFALENYPEELDVDTFDRLTKCFLLAARATYHDYMRALSEKADLESQARLPKLPNSVIADLSKALSAQHARLFKPRAITPTSGVEAIHQRLSQLGTQLIELLDPITSITFDEEDCAKFTQLPSVIRCHMLNLRVLIEQKAYIPDQEAWKDSMLDSLEIAWDYDQLSTTNPDLVRILHGIKKMCGGELSEGIAAIEAKKASLDAVSECSHAPETAAPDKDATDTLAKASAQMGSRRF